MKKGEKMEQSYEFRPYLHVERFGTEEVEGINREDDFCYIFPKLDGSNCCVWSGEDEVIHCGSRKRELSADYDNAGFYDFITKDNSDAIKNLRKFVRDNPSYIVYGEWLGTKNQIRDYINIQFYIFDVYERKSNFYLPYDIYSFILEKAGYPYVIEPLDCIISPTQEQIESYLDKNHFNLPDTVCGEGVVIKNYSFLNHWGHYEVAKIVRDEYKQKKATPKIARLSGEIEEKIANDYITASLVEKTKFKIMSDLNENKWIVDNKHMGMIISTVWHDFMEEDISHAVKKYKNPTINFKILNSYVNINIRKYLGL